LVLYFFELTLQALQGRKGIDFKVLQVLIEVLLVFSIVDFGVYPVVRHLLAIFETDLGYFFNEEVVFIGRVHGCIKL